MRWLRRKPRESTVTEVVRDPLGAWVMKPAKGESLNAEAAALGLVPSFPDGEVSININGRAWHATWQPVVRVLETTCSS